LRDHALHALAIRDHPIYVLGAPNLSTAPVQIIELVRIGHAHSFRQFSESDAGHLARAVALVEARHPVHAVFLVSNAGKPYRCEGFQTDIRDRLPLIINSSLVARVIETGLAGVLAFGEQ
jgi:hypothetical protein